MRPDLHTAIAFAPVLIIALVRMVLVISGGDLALRNSFEDDAFYYLEIAQNIALGNGSTFGGLVSTNGYHPLWLILLVPVAAVAHGTALLVAVYAIQLMLYIGFVGICISIGRQLQAGVSIAVSLLATSVLGLNLMRASFDGMEFGVTLFFLALLLRVVLFSSVSARPLTVGIIASALFLARLDSVFTIAAVLVAGGACAMHFERKAPSHVIRHLAVTAVPLVITFGLYAIVNYWLFDSVTPVSGRAKALGGGSLTVGQLGDFLAYGDIVSIRTYIGLQLLILVAASVVLLYRRRNPLFSAAHDRIITTALGALMTAQLLQLLYYTVSSSWPLWPWYYYSVPTTYFLASITLIHHVVQVLGARRRAVLAIVLVVSSVAGLAIVSWRAAVSRQEIAAHSENVTVAEWVNEHSYAGEGVAMGDRAGAFGWTLHRPLIQLEGLVEDRAFLGFMAQEQIAEKMRLSGVRFYVRWSTRREADALGLAARPTAPCHDVREPAQGGGPKSIIGLCREQLLQVFPMPDGSFYSVWRM